jgi:catechol 2,3-dioxygenase-like lactoylglutathione lyase family enzyme
MSYRNDVTERRLVVILTFVYTPVANLDEALAFYRDTLGLKEAWREGESTVSFELPGTDVQLMIDQADASARPGPIFIIDSVEEFYGSRRDELRFRSEPEGIPGGSIVSLEDPAGNRIYVMDQALERVGAEA